MKKKSRNKETLQDGMKVTNKATIVQHREPIRKKNQNQRYRLLVGILR